MTITPPKERFDRFATARVTAVGGTTFTVAEPDGRATTVVASGTTSFARRAAADLDDAVVGSWVTARGEATRLGFVADRIAIRPAPSGGSSGHDGGRGDDDGEFVSGTLKDVHLDAGIATLETGDGVVVVVVTLATRVVASGAVTMRDVVPGLLVEIEGERAANGTVAADIVQLGAPRTPPVPD